MKKNIPEENRKLSKAEKRRLEQFEQTSADLQAQGYRRHDLTIGIVRANVIVLIAAVPLFAAGLFLYFAVNRGSSFSLPDYWGLWFILSYLILIPAHELIHGVTWAVFSSGHFKDIEFGFMREYLTPYCTCREPLGKGAYILGALMPTILLGVIPAAAGILTGSFLLLLIGIIMILSGGGDILIVLEMLRFRSDGEVLYHDHPTQAGVVAFVRQAGDDGTVE